MKKGKLTATEKACIEGMIASDISIEGMATHLDRSVSIVEKETEKIKAQSVRNQLYINKTAYDRSRFCTWRHSQRYDC